MLAGKSEVICISGANQSVYHSIRRFAMEGLNDLIRVLMESVDDALFELSDKVDNDRERNLYFEAMREIRIKRESLQHNFDYELRRRFERLVNPPAEEDADVDDEELTLVELEEIEDSIAIDNMIKKARPHFEDDLFAVDARLRALLRRQEIGSDHNPLDPKSICDSFHCASDVLDTEIQVKLIFYKLFDRYVVNNLGHFYRELNALFVQKGVLPDFNAEQERMRQTTRFMANRIRVNPPASGAASTWTGGAGAVNTAPGGGAGMPPGNAPMAGGGLYATLQQAVGGMAVAPGGPGGEVFEPAGGLVVEGNSAAFVAALSGLQLDSRPTIPLAAMDPQQLRAETRQQIQGFRQLNQHQVAAADNQTIDVVSMLFDFFFDDEALPPPIKVLIGRLQIPILKVAILDKDFFNHKKHPARRLLDSLSRAALGWSENEQEERALIDKAEEIVNFLVDEFDQDISVFEQALDNLESFLEREGDARRQAEEALREEEERRDQRIQEARDAASALIERLTAEQELGFEVIDFLDTTWSSVLFNAYLAMGPESNHWKNLARISATLVWTLKPKHSEEERNKILKMIPSMLRALSRGMDLVKIKTEVQNRIFQMLAQQHAVVVKLTARNIASGQGAEVTDMASARQAANAPAAASEQLKAAQEKAAEAQAAAVRAAEEKAAAQRAAEERAAAERAAAQAAAARAAEKKAAEEKAAAAQAAEEKAARERAAAAQAAAARAAEKKAAEEKAAAAQAADDKAAAARAAVARAAEEKAAAARAAAARAAEEKAAAEQAAAAQAAEEKAAEERAAAARAAAEKAAAEKAAVARAQAEKAAADKAAAAQAAAQQAAAVKAAEEKAAAKKAAQAAAGPNPGRAGRSPALAEPLAEVERTPANQVIEDLEQFTRGVSNGEIAFEDEIVLVDESGQDLELSRVDDWTEQANAVEIGSWIEFSESESRVMMARLSWKSQVSGNLVFVNRKGQRVRNMSIGDLAAELRSGKAAPVEASSVFDRAVYSIMNKMAG